MKIGGDNGRIDTLQEAQAALEHVAEMVGPAGAEKLRLAVASWTQHAQDPAAQMLASSLAAIGRSMVKAAGLIRRAASAGAPAATPSAKGKLPKAKVAKSATPKKASRATKTRSHTVRSGDTLWGIAQRSGVPLSRLIAANPQIEDPDLIFPGQKVKVPRGGGDAPPPADAGQHADTAQAPTAQRPSHVEAGDPVASASSAHGLSASAKKQMANLLKHAKENSAGKRPQGWCLREVGDILDRTTYGKIGHGGLPRFGYAHDVADWLNEGQRWKKMGLKKLDIHNPYDAPPGAIVVVRAGTPGTHHPTAGDIAIAAGGGRFLNDGEMGYGGPGGFPRGNNYVLGVYVPA